MIDLGRYAFDIWLAYAVTGALVIGLVVQSVVASRNVKRRLEEQGE